MRDAPVIGRSPVKNIAFRTLRTSKKKYCVCGRALVYFKDSQAWCCGECGYVEYIPKQQQPEQQIGGVMSVDGLSDTRTTPNRGPMKFRSMDPRKRFLKKESEIDDELARILENQSATLVSYHSQVQQSNDVVSSDDLRANK